MRDSIRLRLETFEHPCAAVGPPVAQPVVQAIVAVLPELELVGHEPVAAPERRERHVAVAEARLRFCRARLELRARPDRFALRRRPRADAARPWAIRPSTSRTPPASRVRCGPSPGPDGALRASGRGPPRAGWPRAPGPCGSRSWCRRRSRARRARGAAPPEPTAGRRASRWPRPSHRPPARPGPRRRRTSAGIAGWGRRPRRLRATGHRHPCQAKWIPRQPDPPPVRRPSAGAPRLQGGIVRALAEPPTPPPKLTSIESDDDRIRTFVDGEYRQVVATVALVCGSVATAEDSVQEALARAWEHIARGKEIDRLPAWVTTVALNLARSQMRRWRSERRARTPARGAAPGDPRRHRRERRGLRGPRGAPRAPPPPTRGHRAALLPRSRRPRDRRASRDRRGNGEGDAVPRPAVPRGDARRHPRTTSRSTTVPIRDEQLERSMRAAAPHVSTVGVLDRVADKRARRRTSAVDSRSVRSPRRWSSCSRPRSCSSATTTRPHARRRARRARHHRRRCGHAEGRRGARRRSRSRSTRIRATCAGRWWSRVPPCRWPRTTTTATRTASRRRASCDSTVGPSASWAGPISGPRSSRSPTATAPVGSSPATPNLRTGSPTRS